MVERGFEAAEVGVRFPHQPDCSSVGGAAVCDTEGRRFNPFQSLVTNCVGGAAEVTIGVRECVGRRPKKRYKEEE